MTVFFKLSIKFILAGSFNIKFNEFIGILGFARANTAFRALELLATAWQIGSLKRFCGIRSSVCEL